MGGTSGSYPGGRLLEWWSSGRKEAPQLKSGTSSCKKVESGAFIVSVVDPLYLITLLSLRFTMSSYLSTMPLVLVVRRASVGKECRPYLCQVGCTTTDAPHTCIQPAACVGSTTSTGQLFGGTMMWRPGQHLPYHSFPPGKTFSRCLTRVLEMRSCAQLFEGTMMWRPGQHLSYHSFPPGKTFSRCPTRVLEMRSCAQLLACGGVGLVPSGGSGTGWTERSSGVDPIDVGAQEFERVVSGTNSGGLAQRMNSGANRGDLAKRVNSKTNLEDLAKRVNSKTNLEDLTERVNSGANPEDLPRG
ncbi:hypothetical protein BHM03_00052180 [Ensete ventricosum]|nr:hypothetical protein BHM03_00052180 [Ensete ventricosum]